jgi:hypothetical protein
MAALKVSATTAPTRPPAIAGTSPGLTRKSSATGSMLMRPTMIAAASISGRLGAFDKVMQQGPPAPISLVRVSL